MLVLLAATAFAEDPRPEAAERDRVFDYVQPSADLGDVRLALAFGDYDTARTLASPLADAYPMDADLAAAVGLTWMGSYYARYGLSQASFERVQGAAVDPAGALAAGPLLAPDDVARALARGFAIPGDLPSSVRGGSTVPAELSRARVAFDHAARLTDDPAVLLDQFVVEAEIAHWGGPAPELRAHRAEIERSMPSWPADTRALAEVDLGVADVLAGDVKKGLAAFLRAEALGSPLGRYDAALLYSSVPAVYDREAAATRFATLASADRAAGAGLLPTATSWPLGAGRAELVSSDASVLALVDAVEANRGDGVVTLELADGTHVLVANGSALARVGAAAPAPAVVEREAVDAVAMADEQDDATAPVLLQQTETVSSAMRRPRLELPKVASGPGRRASAALAEEGPSGDAAALAVPSDTSRTVSVRTLRTCAPGASCVTLLEVRPSE